MLVLGIVIALLLLLLLLPIGIDAAYFGKVLKLYLKVGLIRLRLFPKPRWLKRRKAAPAQKAESGAAPPDEGGGRRLLSRGDIPVLAKILLKAASRLRRALSIDLLILHILCGGDDPYDTVLRFGYLNAVLSALSPLFHTVFKVRREDTRIGVDLKTGESILEIRAVMTLQVWEIIFIDFCAGFALFRWYRAKQRSGGQKVPENAEPITQKG